MSVKTTYSIPREVAIQTIVSHVFKATDDELAEMLEALPESQFRNYRIDGVGYSFYIDSIDDFYNR